MGASCTVYPKKYAHGFCFAVLCCGYTLTDFPISIRLTSLALWQSNDCPSASKATLMNMDKYFMWIHYERLHNHNKAKHNKTVCIFLGIYCITGAKKPSRWLYHHPWHDGVDLTPAVSKQSVWPLSLSARKIQMTSHNVIVNPYIRLSVRTVNRTYEISWITHVTPFRRYGKHSTGPSNQLLTDNESIPAASCSAVSYILTDCSYGAQSNEIYTHGRVSRGSHPRVRGYSLLYLRTVEYDHWLGQSCFVVLK